MTQDDYTLFIFAMMAVWVIAQAISIIWPKGRKHLMERPVDVHGTLYRNRKRAARRNLRGTRIKRVICTGEADYYDMDYGRLAGLLSGPHCEDVFIRTERARPPLWAIVPKELMRDKHGSNLVIECNGFEPLGNFYVPVYCSDTSPELVDYYNDLILRHEAYLVQREKDIELAEQGAHAMKDALSVKSVNTNIRDRQDSVPVVQSKEERYDERAIE